MLNLQEVHKNVQHEVTSGVIFQKLFYDNTDTHHYNLKVVATTPKIIEIKAKF